MADDASLLRFDLVLIADPQPGAEASCLTRTESALAAAPAGRIAVQLRAKAWEPDARERLGKALRQLTQAHAAPLIVNGDLALAKRLTAEGVQLPEGSIGPQRARDILGEQSWVGCSCHDLHGLQRAAREGADFATLSPYAASPGKGAPLGAQRFARLARAVTLPVYALGGIGRENAGEAVAAGARGVAVIRAVYGGEDPGGEVRALLAAMDAGRQTRA